MDWLKILTQFSMFREGKITLWLSVLLSQSEFFFSCEEAALEVQMLSVCVCLTPKLNIIKNRLFEVYTKPINCTRVHKTSLLYKCIQN